MSQPCKKRKVVRCSQTPRIETYFVNQPQLSQSSAELMMIILVNQMMSFKKVNNCNISPSLISSADLVDTCNSNGQEEPLSDFDEDNISREETLEEIGTTSEDI